jgi:hypothetical protein
VQAPFLARLAEERVEPEARGFTNSDGLTDAGLCGKTGGFGYRPGQPCDERRILQIPLSVVRVPEQGSRGRRGSLERLFAFVTETFCNVGHHDSVQQLEA